MAIDSLILIKKEKRKEKSITARYIISKALAVVESVKMEITAVRYFEIYQMLKITIHHVLYQNQ